MKFRPVLIGLCIFFALPSAAFSNTNSIFDAIAISESNPLLASHLLEGVLDKIQKSPLTDEQAEVFFRRVDAELSPDQQDALFRIVIDYSKKLPLVLSPSLREVFQGGPWVKRFQQELAILAEQNRWAEVRLWIKAPEMSPHRSPLTSEDADLVRKELSQQEGRSASDLFVAFKTSHRLNPAVPIEDLIRLMSRIPLHKDFFWTEIERDFELRRYSLGRQINARSLENPQIILDVLNLSRGALRASIIRALRESRSPELREPVVLLILKTLESRTQDFESAELRDLAFQIFFMERDKNRPYRRRMRALLQAHPEWFTRRQDSEEVKIRTGFWSRDIYECSAGLKSLWARLIRRQN